MKRRAVVAAAAVLLAGLLTLVGCAGEGSSTAGLGELLSCSHGASGDMNGNLHLATLEADEAGALVLTVEDSPDHMTPVTVREYRADDDALDLLRAIIDRYGMTAWDGLPMSEFFPLDAAGNSISMRFASTEPEGIQEYFSVDFYSELPEGGTEAFGEFVDCLCQWETDDRLIREYVRDDE